MNHRTRAVLPFLFCTALAVAQDHTKRGGAAPTPAPTPAAEATPSGRRLLSLRFEGGTLADFVEVVRRTDPRANIVASADALATEVPALQIVDSTLGQLLDAVVSVHGNRRQVGVGVSQGVGEPIYALFAVAAAEETGAPRPSGPLGPRGAAKEQPTTRVFSLNALIEPVPGDPAERPIALRTETILSAVQAALQNFRAPLQLAYHEESGLLITSGQPMQMEVVGAVLQQLGEDQRMRRERALQARHLEEMGAASGGGVGAKK